MTRRLVCLPILVALTAALLVSIGAAPARATISPRVDVPNGVLYDTCRYHQFSYAVDPALDDWDLSVTAVDPRGVESAFAYLYQGANPASGTTRGSDGLFFCGSEPKGRWHIRAEVSYWQGWDYITETLPTTSFKMRKARTRANLRVNDKTARVGQRIKFKVKVKGEFPAKYARLPYAKVILKRRTSHGWKRFGSTYANERGVAKFKKTWKWRHRVKVKAVAKPGHPYRKARDTIVIR